MTHPVRSTQLLTDLRELIEIVDRRLVQLRRHGNQEAIRKMEEIRNRILQLQDNVVATER